MNKMKYWIEISQRLVQMFVEDQLVQVKKVLTKYYALLHYTGIKHAILLALLPISTESILDVPPPNSDPASAILVQPTLLTLSSLPLSPICLILFLSPCYYTSHTGPMLSKCLATPGDQEAYVQFKAVGFPLRWVFCGSKTSSEHYPLF